MASLFRSCIGELMKFDHFISDLFSNALGIVPEVLTFPSRTTQRRRCVNPFVRCVNGGYYTYGMLEDMCKINLERTLQLLFFFRDPYAGYGERLKFIDAIAYLYGARGRFVEDEVGNECKELILRNIHLIPEIGRWKDLVELYAEITDTEFRDAVLTLFNDTLRKDLENYGHHNVSNCAKWVPTEGSSLDRECHFTTRLAKRMQVTKAELRKEFLTLLRKQIRVQPPISRNENHISSLSLHYAHAKEFDMAIEYEYE